ncbi:hypothetical protein QAD02_021040 [Eretmocerus hayati]|uniref:Uncharacterized protein n=1 Tax=Eretmocerus hayati TaxID=131215 RepID=A0ACC2PPC3_9HYME|nr:hypothetical protein QAD02_021040 [Eretmocerus hayati]
MILTGFTTFIISNYQVLTKLDLDSYATSLTCDLYSNLDLSRTNVQFIIEKLSHLIGEVDDPFLPRKLNESFEGAVRKEVPLVSQRSFEKYRPPFKHSNTELKRLQVYTRIGLYKESTIRSIVQVTISKLIETNLNGKTEDVSIVRFPIADGLKRLFEIEGLFEATLNYYNHLRANNYPSQNFCQAALWDRKSMRNESCFHYPVTATGSNPAVPQELMPLKKVWKLFTYRLPSYLLIKYLKRIPS